VSMLVLTLAYPIMYDKWGDFDWGPAWVGYLGLILVAMSFLAIGLFASGLTRSQMASAGICLAAFLFVWLVGWVSYLIGGEDTWLKAVAKNISVFEVFGDFEKGLLNLKSVIYFVSMVVFFLFMTVRVLELRRQV